MGAGATFWFQHHVLPQGQDTLSIFDDGGAPPAKEPQSRAILLNLDTTAMRATLQRSYVHPAGLAAANQGSVQVLADGEVLVGAVAVGPDAAGWMAEVTLAIRAKVPVAVLADAVHAYPTYGEALETAFRELAGAAGHGGHADQEEEGIGPVSELDMEVPEGDAYEQQQEVVADDSGTERKHEVPFDVDEADAAEQERAVGFDDDDYR